MNLEIIQKICLSFPAVTEDVKWENNLCFSVGEKIFCLIDLNPPHNFTFKVRKEEFDELSVRDGFMPAPYLARASWVTVTNLSGLSKKELNSYIKGSYEMIKMKIPVKQKKALGLL